MAIMLSPIASPKSQRPRSARGEENGSVAINRAHKSRLPEKTWKSGLSPASSAHAANVAMQPVGCANSQTSGKRDW